MSALDHLTIFGRGVNPRNAPDLPAIALPNSSMSSETPHVACNEPLIVQGVIVGYCDKWVNPKSRWRRFHKGPCAVEWWPRR